MRLAEDIKNYMETLVEEEIALRGLAEKHDNDYLQDLFLSDAKRTAAKVCSLCYRYTYVHEQRRACSPAKTGYPSIE